jgi:hypothetical protein
MTEGLTYEWLDRVEERYQLPDPGDLMLHGVADIKALLTEVRRLREHSEK